MKTKSDKELLEAIEARERLESKGYRKRKCGACKGIGFIRLGYPCLSCGGKGYHWESPLT